MVVVKERDESKFHSSLESRLYRIQTLDCIWPRMQKSSSCIQNQKIQERKICHLDQVAKGRNQIDEALVHLGIRLGMEIFSFHLVLEDFLLDLLVLLETKVRTHLALVNLKLR